MAKKLISLLCALVMLASMVTIVATVATAESTTVNLLASENMDKWTVTRGGSGLQTIAGAVDLTGYSGWTDKDIQGVLSVHTFVAGTNLPNMWAKFTYADTPELGDDFSVFMTPYIRARIYDRAPDDDAHVALTLGKYTFAYTRPKDNAGTSGNRSNFCLVVSKDGTEIGRTEVTSDVNGASFGGKTFMEAYPSLCTATGSNIPAGSAGNAGVLQYWRERNLAVNGNAAGALRPIACNAEAAGDIDNRSARDYTIVVKDGKLSVKDVNGNALSFGDKTEFDVTASDFKGAPVVDIKGDALSTDSPLLMLRLTATIGKTGSSETTSSGDAASDTTSSEDASSEDTASDTTSSDTASPEEPAIEYTKAMPGFAGKATVVSDGGNPNYVAAFHAAKVGDAMTIYGTGKVKADLGKYDLDAFKYSFGLAGRDGFEETAVVTVGDLVVTVAHTTNTTLYNISASYKGNALTFAPTLDKYDWDANSKGTLLKTAFNNLAYLYRNRSAEQGDYAAAENTSEGVAYKNRNILHDACVEANVGYHPGTTNATSNDIVAHELFVEVEYANGKLTISTPKANKRGDWAVEADMSGATFTDAAASVEFSISTDNYYQGFLVDWDARYVGSAKDAEDIPVAPEQPSSDTQSEQTSSDTQSEQTASEIPVEDPNAGASVPADLEKMGGIGDGTVTEDLMEDGPTPVDEINWNITRLFNGTGSGVVTTDMTGKGIFICNGNQPISITDRIGEYAIDKYFKINFEVFGKAGTPKLEGNAKYYAGKENWSITVGDFVFNFTRAQKPEQDSVAEAVSLASVTYKGREMTIEGERLYGGAQANDYGYNSEIAQKSIQQVKDNADALYERHAWMIANYAFPTFGTPIEITYNNGKISVVAGKEGGEKKTAVIDMTKVSDFDATAELGAAKVAVNINATQERGEYNSAIGNFSGVYAKGTAVIGGNGSGSGSGSAKTGDARSVALPFAILMLCVSAAGLILVNRKRTA